jgi:hypothetical protein
MNNRNLINLLFGALVLSSFSSLAIAGATPTMFNECAKHIKIKSPLKGAGVYFNDNCTVAYVLPPRHGKILVSTPTKTPNTRLCSTYDGMLKTAEARASKAKRIIKMIEQEEEKLTGVHLQDPWITSVTPSTDVNPENDQLEKLREQAEDIITKQLQFNEVMAQYEGPKIRLTIEADQNAMVDEYQKLNPEVTFRPMPLAKGALTFTAKTEKNIGKAAAALYWGVAGIKTTPSSFTGIKPEDLVQNSNDSTGQVLFASSVSGQMVLSLLGACPLVDASGNIPADINESAINSYIDPSIAYVYNLAVNRSYYARYNIAELFKRIQKQSTKGGLFSSKTIHSLVIERDSSAWFVFKADSEDPRHEWEEQLRQTVKAEIIARALQRVGVTPIGTSEVPGIIPPGRTGASVISEGLGKCPHIYCQAGAFVLAGLDTVFSKKSAISEFISKNNFWEEETVKETKMVPQIGQVSFEK